MPRNAQAVLRTCHREEFSLERLSYSFLQGERYQPLYFQENIYAHTLSRLSHNPHSRCGRIQPSHSTLEI